MTYIAPVPITHSSIAGNVPNTAAELSIGALAVNVADGTLYTKDYTGRIVRVEGDTGNTTLASAATLDLGNVMAAVVDVTGTTAITAVNLRVGQSRTVRFTSVLTLTHGANLVLPGADSITTTAGDFAVFRGFAGGVVRCVSYSFYSAGSFPSGSAAAPSISHRGDPSTGMYFPSNYEIGLSVAGQAKIHISTTEVELLGHIRIEGVPTQGATGSNWLVFNVAPTLLNALLKSPTCETPNLGTPTVLVATNATGIADGLMAGDSKKLESYSASHFATAAALAALSTRMDSFVSYTTHSHSFSGSVSGSSCSGSTDAA